jgi:preprotein translocase subunit SecF
LAKKEFDFVAKRKTFMIIPCVVLAAAIIVLLIFNLEVAIEFKGGTMLTYSYDGDVDLAEIEDYVSSLGYNGVRVTRGSSIGGELETFTIGFASTEGLSSDAQQEISQGLISRFEHGITLENSQDVSASTGSSFFFKCLVAVFFSFVVLMIYIGFRFKKIGGWSAGLFALIALLVDVMVVISTFIFFRLSVDANFMAVVLTILGYSINNTIVVYDRIRENRNLYGKKLSFTELVNKSVNQSLTRSVYTTVTTAAAVIVICVVAVFMGVPSIISFAFPMFVGLCSGLFSSLCLAGPLWAGWKERKSAKTA